MLNKTYSVKPHCVSRSTIYIYVYVYITKMIHGPYIAKLSLTSSVSALSTAVRFFIFICFFLILFSLSLSVSLSLSLSLTFVAQQPKSGLGSVDIEVSRSHTARAHKTSRGSSARPNGHPVAEVATNKCNYFERIITSSGLNISSEILM